MDTVVHRIHWLYTNCKGMVFIARYLDGRLRNVNNPIVFVSICYCYFYLVESFLPIQ